MLTSHSLFQGATGVVILRSGLNSYAAEVLRGKGRPAVVGVRNLHVNLQQRALCSADGAVVVREGDLVTVDGSGGVLYSGRVPTREAGSGEFFSIVMGWADKHKRMHIQADCNSLQEVLRARDLGAEGVGVYRSESIYQQEGCADIFRQAVLAQSVNERCSFLAKLVTAHQLHYEEVFRAMNHRPVSVRLLDLALEEFFPKPSSGDVDDANFCEAVGEMADRLGLRTEECERNIRLLQNDSGRRLSVLYPEMVIMQTKAIAGMNTIAFIR